MKMKKKTLVILLVLLLLLAVCAVLLFTTGRKDAGAPEEVSPVESLLPKEDKPAGKKTDADADSDYETECKYVVVYLVDGQQYGEAETYKEGDLVKIRPLPVIEGKTVSEWSIMKDFLMPDESVFIRATTSTRVIKVSWVIEGQTREDYVEYNSIPVFVGTPEKKASGGKEYIFTGWTPSIDRVTSDTTYTAVFQEKTGFVVTWKNDSGTVFYQENLKAGDTPQFNTSKYGTPQKDPSEKFTYTFKEWSPAVSKVTKDITYTATYTQSDRMYTVNWCMDGQTLKTESLKYGEMPSYTGTPEKTRDGTYTYTFKGWDQAVVPVTKDTSYYATFDRKYVEYYVSWEIEGYGEPLDAGVYHYGDIPSTSAVPEKASDEQYSYIFKGWSPSVSAVTKDTVYTALFDKSLKEYVITWEDENGTVLRQDSHNYGEMPSPAGLKTQKADTTAYTYKFSKWSPDITVVNGNKTYKATYTAEEKTCTVNWWNPNGQLLDTQRVRCGEIPKYEGTPSRAPTAQYTYEFLKWDPAVTEVRGNANYTAVYKTTVNEYTVTWNLNNGTTKTETYRYGEVPTYKFAEPAKTAAGKSYTFTGWKPDITSVSKDITYTADFTETIFDYTVSWLNFDDSVLATETAYKYGDTPSYKGSTPQKSPTDKYVYVFKGWTPQIVSVTAGTSYKAEYTESTRQYTHKWMDASGNSVLYSTQAAFEATPAYSGSTPVKAEDAAGTYTFKAWSRNADTEAGEIVYTPEFNVNAKSYTIVFINYNGKELARYTVPYDEVPVYSGELPFKPTDVNYYYDFSGWFPAVSKVSGDAVYQAQFTASEVASTYDPSANKTESIILD